jgi:hypothetical protein
MVYSIYIYILYICIYIWYRLVYSSETDSAAASTTNRHLHQLTLLLHTFTLHNGDTHRRLEFCRLSSLPQFLRNPKLTT